MTAKAVVLRAAALAAACAASARADTIYLKNGREMEGIVSQETRTDLTLDLGDGSITLPRSSILRVRRSTGQELKALTDAKRIKELENGEGLPEGSGEIYGLYRRARLARQKARDAKQEKFSLAQGQQATEAEIESLKQRHLELTEAFGSPPPGRGYNQLVQEANFVGMSIQSRLILLENGRKKIALADEAVLEYFKANQAFRDRACGPVPPSFGDGEDGKAFSTLIGRACREWGSDFVQDTVVSEKRGNNLVVKAVLNGAVVASLIVDTGASGTVISQEVARRLRLDQASPLGVQMGTVADGRTVRAKVYLLDSIAVGESRVEKTPAAVMPSMGPGIDGLLGMSFLQNFIVQVEEDRLLLKRLK